MRRREVLQFLATIGVSPAVFVACAEDSGHTGTPDGGLDASPDSGGDAGGLEDVLGNDASDTTDASVEPTDDEPHPAVDAPEEYTWEGPPGPDTLFSHGVASGDPLPDAVIIWTRVSPAEDGPIEVWWEVATDPDFNTRILAGTVTTGPDRDYTVKHDVTGLYPGNTYYYRFFCQGVGSLVGRTRTAPRYGARHLRFAVVSCSNYPNGYFHVYRTLAEQPDLDAVLHLGDYIYEYGGGAPPRAHRPGREIVTLADYRERYAQYRADPDLQAVHQQHPFIVVWDDHETANNSWENGAENHDPNEGLWVDRKAAGIKAWFEWIPARNTPDQRIWRSFRYGNLVDLIMLDTRLWGRDEQVAPAEVDAIVDPERSLLGEDQEAWFAEQLETSTARWRIIGQQVMMGHFKLGDAVLNTDQWDGYEATRLRFLDVLENNNIDNTVVLTGDIHTSWAMDVTRLPSSMGGYDAETGEGSLAVEFVTPAVTSSGLSGVSPGVIDIIVENNPHMRWVDLTSKGYVLVDVTPERVQGAWFFVSDVRQPDFTESFAKAFSTQDGRNHLVEDTTPAPPKADAPDPAPGMPER